MPEGMGYGGLPRRRAPRPTGMTTPTAGYPAGGTFNPQPPRAAPATGFAPQPPRAAPTGGFTPQPRPAGGFTPTQMTPDREAQIRAALANRDVEGFRALQGSSPGMAHAGMAGMAPRNPLADMGDALLPPTIPPRRRRPIMPGQGPMVHPRAEPTVTPDRRMAY